MFLFLFYGFYLHSHPITVDGDDSDWIGAPPPTDTYGVSMGEGIWTDSQNDDLGDGGDAPFALDDPSPYSYPDTSLYTGGEADILEWRITTDLNNNRLYFLVKMADFTMLWQPIVVFTVDTDHVPGSGQTWLPQNADLQVDSTIMWEFSIVIADGNVFVMDQDWNDVTGNSEIYLNPDNEIIEVGVDVSPWGSLPPQLYFTAVAGLGDFGHFREVDSLSSTWFGSGGVGIGGSDTGRFWVEPDVYDLAFVAASDQPNDLNTYSDGTQGEPLKPAVIRTTSAQLVDLNELSVKESEVTKPVESTVLWISNGYIVLKSIPQEINTAEIYGTSGKIRKTFQLKQPRFNHMLDIRALPNGIYFLRLKGNNLQVIRRFIWIQ